MLVLSSVLDAATLQLQPQFPQLLALFSSALEDSGSKAVPFYALQLVKLLYIYQYTLACSNSFNNLDH